MYWTQLYLEELNLMIQDLENGEVRPVLEHLQKIRDKLQENSRENIWGLMNSNCQNHKEFVRYEGARK